MREIEHLSRLYVAYQFVCAEETKLKSAEDLHGMQDAIGKLKESMLENESKVRALSQEIQELEKRRDKVRLGWLLWKTLETFILICTDK